MKNLIKKILLVIGIVFIIFFSVGGYFINKYYHKYVKSHPKRYCYEYFRGTDNPVSVLIIEDIDFREPYLKYYRDIEAGKNPYWPNEIPLKGLPQYSPVYVIEYTKDSLLAKVVSYYDRGAKFGGSFTKGWVYAKTLHKNPPPPQKNKYN